MALLCVLAAGSYGAYTAFAVSGPSVSSFTLNAASPTNAGSVSWKVVFSASVTGVAASNFTLVPGGGLSGAGSISVSGSGTTWTVSASTGSGSGTLGLKLSSVGSIKDSSNRALTGVPYTGPVFTVDKIAPTATLTQTDANPTGASSVHWSLVFSEAVTGVSNSSFTVVNSGLGGSPAASVSGSGASYTVTITTGTGSGSLGVKIASAGSIKDAAGNLLSGTPVVGASYTVDRAPPPAPAINSGPSGLVYMGSASFGFSDGESPVTFLCKLDSGSYAACTSPKSYSGLGQGAHTFWVEAVDPVGNVSGATGRAWTVDTVAPAAPSITAGPAAGSFVASTSASLSFTDSEGGVSFLCRIDGNAFAACTSAKSYSGLSQGSHTFQVEAKDPAGNISGPASRQWTVDTQAPDAPGVGSPVPPYLPPLLPFAWPSTSAGFVFGDTSSDIASYLCEMSPAVTFTACANPVTFNGLAQGRHTLLVKAVDHAGNQSGPSTPYPFFVDTVKPNTPTITVKPPDPNSVATSTFSWTDTDPGAPSTGSGIAGYLCSVENGPFLPLVPNVGGLPQLCWPGVTFNVATTNNGQHQFAVEAVDWAGNVSGSASYKWKVNKGSLQQFTINGNGATPLYPGAPALPINLGFSNTNPGSLSITALTVSVQSVNSPQADPQHPCTTADYAVGQYTGAYPVTMPAGSSTLQSLGIASSKWPTVRMIDSNSNQNGCAGASITLAYTGSAQG